MRDYRNLRTFTLADALITDVYRPTVALPPDERYGLQSQIRRAAVSVATNIVEGSARRTQREYAHFLRTAFASAVEAAYLLGLAGRLGLLPQARVDGLAERYDHLVRMLRRQCDALDRCGPPSASRRPRSAISDEP